MGNVICGDSIKEIKKINDASIHLILSDIPYRISYDEWDVLHNNINSALLGKVRHKIKVLFLKHEGNP